MIHLYLVNLSDHLSCIIHLTKYFLTIFLVTQIFIFEIVSIIYFDINKKNSLNLNYFFLLSSHSQHNYIFLFTCKKIKLYILNFPINIIHLKF